MIKVFLSGNSLRSRLARGGVFSLVATLTTQALGMVASILCARILEKEAFGELSMVRSTIVMFNVFAGTGIGMAATILVAELRDSDKARTGRLIGLFLRFGTVLGMIGTALAILLAKPLAVHTMGNDSLWPALMLGAVILLFTTLSTVQLGILSGLEKFRQVTRLTILDGVLSLLLIPAGAMLWGVAGTVAASSVSAVLMFPVKRFYVNQACASEGIPVGHKSSHPEKAAVLKFVVPAVLVNLAAQPFDWLARLILVNGPNGYVELGLFTVATSLTQLILFLPGQMGAPTQPILANLVGNGQTIQVRRLLVRGTLILALTAAAAGFVLILLSRFLLSLYGPEYQSASSALMILIFAAVLAATTPILKNFLYARNRVWSVVWAHLAMDIVLCLTAFALLSRGASGLAIAYVLGWLILFLYEATIAYLDLRRQTLVIR